MTGEMVAQLIRKPSMIEAVNRMARRYSRRVEDQEEYIQDAWMRIAQAPDGKSEEWYCSEARRAIFNTYQRNWRRVCKKARPSANGIGRKGMTGKPRDSINLGNRRYLNRKPTRLSEWYYEGEWLQYGLTQDELRGFSVHEIVVLTK